MTDLALLPSSSSRSARLRDQDEEIIRVMTKTVNELGPNGLSIRSHLAAFWTSVFLRGAIKPPANACPSSSPKFMTSSRYRCMPPTRIRPSATAALTSVDGAEEKGYERLPPLDESMAAHLCLPTAIGWKARASNPSNLCICARWTHLLCGWTSRFGVALYIFQAKMLALMKPVWMQLHSGT